MAAGFGPSTLDAIVQAAHGLNHVPIMPQLCLNHAPIKSGSMGSMMGLRRIATDYYYVSFTAYDSGLYNTQVAPRRLRTDRHTTLLHIVTDSSGFLIKTLKTFNV